MFFVFNINFHIFFMNLHDNSRKTATPNLDD